jgi:Ca2+-binding EF-hand superfamily protein
MSALGVACLCPLWARAAESTPGSGPAEKVEPAVSGVVTPTAVISAAAVSTAAVSPATESTAAESTAAARPADASPIDLAILLNQHMLVVRMQVRYGDAPFVEMWERFAEGKFDSADKDHNGLLDAEEFTAVKPLVASAAANANNRNMAQVNRRRGGPVPQAIVDPTDEVDSGREMIPEVTRQEFVEFLRTTANGPIRTDASFLSSAASRALFKRLDVDHDDKLSAGECEHAFDTLRPLDFAEADLFTPNQLTTGNAGANPYFVPDDASQRATPVRLAVKLLRFSNPTPSLAWVDRIRQHFAAGGLKANDLRRAVMLYDEATLAAIDADGDGALDQAELAHLQWRPIANLELTVDQGREELALPALPNPLAARNRAMNQPSRREGTIESTGVCLAGDFRFDPAVRGQGYSQPARLSMGVEEVELTASGFVAAGSQGQGVQLVNNLKQFDQDKNDYLDEKELRRFGNGPNNNFMALDSNGDGKLYFSEIEEYIDAQAAAAAVRLVVRVVDHDHALFEALDTDRDRRLSRRELAQLVSQSRGWDRDGDGQLAFEEVPRLYTVRVEQDQPQLPFNRFFGFGNFVANESRRLPSQRGPDWFTQMDRNSDGDVSRREFLGTAAQFRQLDADGDQLIDAQEAGRATPAAPAPAGEKTVPASAPAADGQQ